MAEEIIDIINEKNEVIGQDKRSEVVEKNLLRRTCHIFIFNSEGKLLLQKRSRMMLRGPGLYTSSCSGYPDAGESHFEGAQRELREELGIMTDLKFITYFRLKNKTVNVLGALYRGIYDGKFKIDKSEVESVQFFDIESLKITIRNNPGIFTQNFKEAFKVYLEKTVGPEKNAQ